MRTANAGARHLFPVGKFMFRAVQQAQSKSTAVHRLEAARIALLLMVLICCLRERAVGEDKTARQRHVVEVSGVTRISSAPATGEMSRVEISSAGEVVLALSSVEASFIV